LFTGDTLFIGDVGRPDLAKGYTSQELAALLYRSLHQKILRLPDDTQIFPAHGAGSLCGRQMSSDSSSTIGRERQFNYALQARTEQDFVQLLTENLPPRPEYFAQDVELNRAGAAPLTSLSVISGLTPAEVESARAEGVIVLDTRPPTQFGAGHVPGSVNVPLSGQYASWAARLLGLDAAIVIVAEDTERAHESQTRLARVGIEKVSGYVEGGLQGWANAGHALAKIPQISVQQLSTVLTPDSARLCVLDVREPAEVGQGAIANSIRIPLGQLIANFETLDRAQPIAVHCKSGYRSSIAASLLRHAGFENVTNIVGGFDAWKAAGLPVAADAKVASVN